MSQTFPAPLKPAAPIESHFVPPVTFRHLIAGSTYISRKGKTCVFAGRKGGLGYYTSTDSAEVAELSEIAAVPNVQIERETPETAANPEAFTKKPDETIAIAAADAAAPAILEATPEVAAARNNLAAVIAKAGSGSKS